MGRIFDTVVNPVTLAPALNSDFVTANPTHRVFADTNEQDQKLYIHVLNHVKAVRPLPKFGTPSL